MNQTRPHARDVFNDALERPSSERQAYVATVCADAPPLRLEVLELLRAHDQAEDAWEPTSPLIDARAQGNRFIGTRIGAYDVHRLIAAGGMGAVFEATQDRPRRTVALKLIRQGIASRAALRRFEYETQILARLRHPGIAQIYQAGTHDDGMGAMPYFAMEYIPDAASLTEFARSRSLGTRQKLELFASVCDAVNHGHQKGIVHRDLKPSNILVDTAGTAKVIDFGVARATDSDVAVTTLQTDLGQLLGTTQYMSPEQCAADPNDIDTRSDVYSLGVMLYELLCERLPYDLSHVALHEATRVIREQTPPKPSGIDRMLRGDVETIVLKALEKDRDRRYQSAGDLGEDVRRCLRHDPIHARPPSIIYQLRTLARRHRAAVSALAALFGLILVTSIVVSILWIVAVRERAAKEKIAEDAISLFSQQLIGTVRIADLEHNKDLAKKLIEAADQHFQLKFTDQPEILIRCLQTLGTAYVIIGDFTPAERQFLRCIDIATEAFGAEDIRSLQARKSLAAVYRDQADHRRAEEVFLSVLAVERREHRVAPGCWEPLADMYLDIGRCADAERILREVIDINRQPGHDVLAPVYYLTNLASVYRTQGRLNDAERALQEALDCYTQAGQLSPSDLYGKFRPIREMSRLRMVQGRLEEAHALQKEALDGQERDAPVGDEEDRLDAILCVELGGLIDLEQGRIEEAEAQFVSAIDRASTSIRSEHEWWTAHFKVDQARCLMRRQNYDESERLLRLAYDMLHMRLGDEHHRTQNCMRTLAELLETTGRASEAKQWLARCRNQPCR